MPGHNDIKDPWVQVGMIIGSASWHFVRSWLGGAGVILGGVTALRFLGVM